MAEIVEPLHKLAEVFGATGALAVLAWWYERRVNTQLQKRLMRMAASQINAAHQVKAELESVKEIVRAIYNRN